MVKKTKNIKNNLTLIFLLLLLISFSITYFKSFENQLEYEISFNSPEPDFKDNSTKIDEEKLAKYEVEKLREQYSNNDIKGRLIITDTGIDIPILQSNDNSYYLYHNAYGDYQAEGSVYLDYRTNPGDKKILIFGHSSPGWDVPFNNLEKYYDKEFYAKHKTINIYSDNGIDTYEIFSVYVETSDFTYMNLKIGDDTYNEYLRKYQRNSMYETGVNINDGDKIIILQTCSNHPSYSGYKKKFLLVIGKKINKEENK